MTTDKTERAIRAHMKVKKVAALLDKCERWVKEEIKDGKLEGFRLGNEIVVSVESLNNYIESRRMRKLDA